MLGAYSDGRRMVPFPTHIFFFFNKDGNENVARKFNLLSFKFYRVFLDPLNLSNVSDFSWS